MATPIPKQRIATHSVGDGLDFACNLLSGALGRAADSMPDRAPGLLRKIAEYIGLRYAGEDGLALEHLLQLADELGPAADVRWGQFWEQMKWLGNELSVPVRSPEAG